MKMTKLFDGPYQWLVFSRDENESEKSIDTNQYVVRTPSRCLLLDPGGSKSFAPMLAAILHHAPVEEITDIFASHQDPDVISSLGMWDQVLTDARLHASALWKGFIRHLDCDSIEYVPIPDNGGTIRLENVELQILPAHYLHSSTNFHLYDPNAKILMSGDVGTALEEAKAAMFVENFDAHTDKMRFFHQRWLPSNKAKRNWVERIRKLDIDMLAPQHGRILRGDDVTRFLDWFDSLTIGTAC